jgi:hypothetical protein
MCSGCSGGYQDDYEDPETDDLDHENPSGAAKSTLDSREYGRRHMSEGPSDQFRNFGASEAQQRGILRPFEEGYEVLVGADRILEIRIVRAKPVEFGELQTKESPNLRNNAAEKNGKCYQTFAIGYPPYDQPPKQSFIRLLIFGLATFWTGTLAAWIFLR